MVSGGVPGGGATQLFSVICVHVERNKHPPESHLLPHWPQLSLSSSCEHVPLQHVSAQQEPPQHVAPSPHWASVVQPPLHPVNAIGMRPGDVLNERTITVTADETDIALRACAMRQP